MNVAANKMPALAVGDDIVAACASWSFGGTVAQNFEQHVMRSVPSYALGHDIVLELSDFFIDEDSVCYEIGTSTGTLISALAARHKGKGKWVGLDVEPLMIDYAQQRVKSESADSLSLTFEVADACDYDYANCDLIVAYYTVQFIRPRARQKLLDSLYQVLNWGGALVIFEKVRAPDARFQDICTALYQDFKLKNDFSPAEIMAKASSLRGVLEPFSTKANVELLERAGFSDIMTIHKHICFEGFLAIK
jgi:tRNA (cmo5U34)-methyltransferase